MKTEVYKRVRLRGVSGSDRDGEYFLDKDVFRVGRAPGSELVLADRTVSGRHARIVRLADGFWLEDLGSTNGTFANGRKIDRQRLRTGDRIAFDKIEFVFEDPGDVPRTFMAASENGESAPVETASRQKVNEAPRKRGPETRKLTPESAESRRGLYGLLLGLVLAFLVGYAGLLAASLAAGGMTRIPWAWFTNTAWSYPFMYLYTPWAGMDPGPPLFLALAGILLAPVMGGFAAWRLGRGSRLRTVMLFSGAYAGLSMIFSLASRGFNVSTWHRMFPGFVPSMMPGISNVVLGVAVIWAVCFLLGLLGSALSR